MATHATFDRTSYLARLLDAQTADSGETLTGDEVSQPPRYVMTSLTDPVMVVHSAVTGAPGGAKLKLQVQSAEGGSWATVTGSTVDLGTADLDSRIAIGPIGAANKMRAVLYDMSDLDAANKYVVTVGIEAGIRRGRETKVVDERSESVELELTNAGQWYALQRASSRLIPAIGSLDVQIAAAMKSVADGADAAEHVVEIVCQGDSEPDWKFTQRETEIFGPVSFFETRLNGAVSEDDTDIDLDDASFCYPGTVLVLDTDGEAERATVASVDGNQATIHGGADSDLDDGAFGANEFRALRLPYSDGFCLLFRSDTAGTKLRIQMRTYTV